MLDRAKEQLIKLLQTYRTYCESRKVLPPPKGGDRAASMLRCPAWSLSKMDESQIGDVQPLYLRIQHSEQSSNRSLQVERVSLIGGQSGRANLLSSWFIANEKTLEDIDVKAAPNSNGKFSKSDVTAENATLPDETPVLQYSLNVHP